MLSVCKKILSNSKGFSIIQAIIAAGVVGAASVGVMHMSSNQIEELLYLETKQEEEALVKQIERMMMQTTVCTQTFQGNSMGATTNENAIVDQAGNAIFDVATDSYGGGAIKIESIELENDATNPVVASAEGDAWAVITLRRLKRKKGAETIVKRIKLSATSDAGNNLVSCHSDVSEYINQAVEEMCTAIGGVINAAGDCDLSCASADPGHAVSAACLALKTAPGGAYDQRWLQISGGTVNGNLTFTNTGALAESLQAATINSNLFCVGSRCRDFSASSCAVGEIVKGVNTDGSPRCVSISCPGANQYLRGIDASGNAVCNTFPTDGCPAGQYANTVNSDGTLNCVSATAGSGEITPCPSGEYIAAIDAAENPTCVRDRRAEMEASNPTGCPAGEAIYQINGEVAGCRAITDKNVHGKTCSSGEYLRGFDVNGIVVCESFGAPSPSYSCTGSAPANSQICSDAGSALTQDRSFTHNASCAGSGDSCEFQCDTGFTWNGSICEADAVGEWCQTGNYDCESAGYAFGQSCTPSGYTECTSAVTQGDPCSTLNDECYVSNSGGVDHDIYECLTSCTAPPSYSCTGSIPSDAVACSNAGTALTQDRSYTHNASCSGSGDSCEFQCESGFTYNSGTGLCEAAPTGGSCINTITAGTVGDGDPFPSSGTYCTCIFGGSCSVADCCVGDGDSDCSGTAASCNMCDNFNWTGPNTLGTPEFRMCTGGVTTNCCF